MSTKNEEAFTRSTQAEFESLSITGSGGTLGGESKAFGSQQERNYRKSGSQSSFFSPGASITGGMLDHLIDEYCNQVEAKESEIQHANDEIKRLKSRIQELEALKQGLNEEVEESQ